MAFTLLLIVLIVVATYFFLGTPLLDFIHKFTKEFTHTFPLWSFFLPVTAASPRTPGGRPRCPRRRGRRT